MKVVLFFVVVVGALYSVAQSLAFARQKPRQPCEKPSMGHHYQRDTVFHDILGM